MENTFLLITVDADTADHAALATLLKPYRATEFITGTWMVHTELTAMAFHDHMAVGLGDTACVVIPIDQTMIQRSYFPADVRDFLGIAKATAA